MNIDKLNKSIFEGIENACYESVMFRGFSYPDIKPEYLLTVNIAQAIYRSFRGEVLIALEEQTDVYKSNLFNKSHMTNYLAFVKATEITRKGLIDIALYDKAGQSICPIEVKGFTEVLHESYFGNVFKDIKRNIEFLLDNTGASNISQAVSTFIFQDTDCKIAYQKPDSINRIRTQCEAFIDKKLSSWKDNFTFKIEAQTVYENLFDSDEHIEAYNEEDIHAEMIEKIHYVGLIINITKIGANVNIM